MLLPLHWNRSINTNATQLTLCGQIHIRQTADQLFEDLGQAVLEVAERAVEDRGVFHLALSGGSTPKPFYEFLAQKNRYPTFPWPATHVWVVDERRVAQDDDRNNFRMIYGALAGHVAVPNNQIHPVPVLADDPAEVYEQQLLTVFGSNTTPRLDFVLLGIGADSHTASLFPGSPALTVHNKLIVNNIGPQVTPPPRVTMTYPLLNAARHIAVLVVGAGKAPALRRVSQQLDGGEPNPQILPITGVQPTDGQLTWYLDGPATSAASNNGA